MIITSMCDKKSESRWFESCLAREYIIDIAVFITRLNQFYLKVLRIIQ